MLPRHQQPQIHNHKPLQNEVLALNKLLGADILEQAARILDHFVTTSKYKTVVEPPVQLQDKLMEKCEDFETVCDQIYYILEQSKRVLQLEYQQKLIELKAQDAEMEKQQLEKPHQENDPMHIDVEFESSQVSLDPMMELDKSNDQQEQKNTAIDAEDMEELLEIQRDRIERLKNVIVMGMDAEAVKAKDGDKEDLLF